jgi:integrase
VPIADGTDSAPGDGHASIEQRRHCRQPSRASPQRSNNDLPYLERDKDRHGNPRIYVRRNGKRVRIREQEGTLEFAKAYAEALEKLCGELPAKTAPPLTTHPKGTLGYMGAKYFASKEFEAIARKSQQARRSCLEECFKEPLSDDDPEPMGNCPLKHLSSQKIRRLVKLRADQPGAATNRRKHLSALCHWGVEHDYLAMNPARDVKTVKSATGGYYTWTIVDVEKYIERHPLGTKAHLALALLLFTGARRQDMVTFGKQHVRDGWLRYVPLKTIYKRRTMSQKPILPILAKIIAAFRNALSKSLDLAFELPLDPVCDVAAELEMLSRDIASKGPLCGPLSIPLLRALVPLKAPKNRNPGAP